MVASFNNFYRKTWVDFCLNIRKRVFLEFHFKTNRKNIGLLKNGTRGFQNCSPFKMSTCFYVTISESFKRFQNFNFETNFPED